MAKMLANPPRWNPNDREVRQISRPGTTSVLVMDDDTFRVEFPGKSPKDPDAKHFAVGRVRGKTDKELVVVAAHLISGSGVQYFHGDGTLHCPTERRMNMDKEDLIEEVFRAICQIPSPLDHQKAEMAVETFFYALQREIDKNPGFSGIYGNAKVIKDRVVEN